MDGTVSPIARCIVATNTSRAGFPGSEAFPRKMLERQLTLGREDFRSRLERIPVSSARPFAVERLGDEPAAPHYALKRCAT